MKNHTRRNIWRTAAFALGMLGVSLLASCQKQTEEKPTTAVPAERKSSIDVKISAEKIIARTSAAEFQLTPSGNLLGFLVSNNSQTTLESAAPGHSQSVSTGKKEYPGVQLQLAQAEVLPTTGKLGTVGKQIVVTGTIPGTELAETVTVEFYDSFPNLALLSMSLRNAGKADLQLDAVALQRHTFRTPETGTESSPPLWTFQGASLKWGKDEMFPLPAKFRQENPFGAQVPTHDDLGGVGGGIPVVAFWSQNVGEAIGHVETFPLTVSIPVETTAKGEVEASVRIPANTVLKAGEVFATPRTFLSVYAGDFYQPLSLWSRVLDKEGLTRPLNNEENYAVSWCGWGYEFGVTPKLMLDTIPKLKELGIHWATLDDGWFNNYGDWQPNGVAFKGDDIPDMIRKFHDQNIKVQVWWLPLAVEDGKFGYGGRKFVVSEVLKAHPDWLILDKQGKPARMARNLAALCPAVPGVQAYYKQVTERFIRDWGFDGHKLDNIWSMPVCYNPKHHHKSPQDSVNAMGEVYKIIFETTRALKPDSVTQSCPCGTPPNLAWLRYMDQAVTADPVGAIQVRRRIKMYKALLGPQAAIYGDHVELTRLNNVFTDKEEDVGDDFASTLGTGGVLGTKFTWPSSAAKFKNVYLTPEKETHWKEWIGLYNQKLLSKGNFLDLYVYGFDFPEAYAIEKDGHYYYAFYLPEKTAVDKKKTPEQGAWAGEIELRGLPAKSFHVTDYVNHKDFGNVTGPTAKLKVDFRGNLLLEAAPTP